MIKLIKLLIKYFFKSEVEAYKNQVLRDARKIYEDSEAGIRKKYIKFDYVNMKYEAFLAGMSPLYNNNNVLTWLLKKQEQCKASTKKAMSENDDKKALRSVAQELVIEDLLLDLQKFEFQYSEIIAQKKLKGELNNA